MHSLTWNQMAWHFAATRDHALANFPVRIGIDSIINAWVVEYKKSNQDAYFIETDQVKNVYVLARNPLELLHFEKIKPLLTMPWYLIDASALTVISSTGGQSTWQEWSAAQDFSPDSIPKLSPVNPPPRALGLLEVLLLGGWNAKPELLSGWAVTLLDCGEINLANATRERIQNEAQMLEGKDSRVQVVQQNTWLEVRVRLTTLEARIAFALEQGVTSSYAGLLALILARGPEGKLEFGNGRTLLTAQLENTALGETMLDNLASELIRLGLGLTRVDYRPYFSTKTIGFVAGHDRRYLDLLLPLEDDFVQWFYG
jgi:hypothetical protein